MMQFFLWIPKIWIFWRWVNDCLSMIYVNKYTHIRVQWEYYLVEVRTVGQARWV